MIPNALGRSSFSRYPPQAAQCATEYLDVLRRLPPAVLPSILEQVIVYDWRFPAEREQLLGQMGALQALQSEVFRNVVAPFSKIVIPVKLTGFDWVNQPGRFVELLTSYLWSSQQIDAYRTAAKGLLDSLQWNRISANSAHPRLVIFVAGTELVAPSYSLFSNLRQHGLHFKNVDAEEELALPLEILARSAAGALGPYMHWYLDGGKERPSALASGGTITTLSYAMLDPIRKAVLSNMDRAIRSGDGPELLHSRLARMQPVECGAAAVTPDPVLQRFAIGVFTQGSGTQVYSTGRTFRISVPPGCTSPKSRKGRK